MGKLTEILWKVILIPTERQNGGHHCYVECASKVYKDSDKINNKT